MYQLFSLVRVIKQHQLPNVFFRYCYSNNVKQMKREIANNVNICQTFSEKSITPMMFAFHNNKVNMVNLLLDIYDRDLNALEETEFRNAVITFENDLTDDFLSCVSNAFLNSKRVPVLIKTNSQNPPNLIFLRKTLDNKNDICLQVVRKLKEKNGVCDLNLKFDCNFGTSYILMAAYFGMTTILKRLLKNKTLDRNIGNDKSNPLHYAIIRGKLLAAKLLMEHCSNESHFTLSLSNAASSGSSEIFEFITEKVMGKAKWSLREIFSMKLESLNNALHLKAQSKNYSFF